MSIDQRLERFAKPGDDDLVFDVDGLSLDNIVLYEREVLIKLSDGFGWWINTDGEVATFAPGSDDSRVSEVEIHFDFAGMSDRSFDLVTKKLETWRQDKVLVRLLAAPERLCTLVHDNNDWLPIGKIRG